NAVELYDPSRSGGNFTAIAMCRDSAGTYIMDNITGQSALNYWHVTDTGFNLEADVQTIDGTPQSIVMDSRPGLAGEIYWAIKNSAGRIYFGDNSGTANAANQYYDAGAGDYRLAGCGPVADNEGMFYWTSSDANGYESLLGYSSASD